MKNKAPVDLAEKLSLEPFCATPPGGDYHLRSLVHHIGARPSSGHYLANAIRPYRARPTEHSPDSKEEENSPSATASTEDATTAEPAPPEEEWITFDDSNSCKRTLSSIQESSTNQQTAYMLLYSLDP